MAICEDAVIRIANWIKEKRGEYPFRCGAVWGVSVRKVNGDHIGDFYSEDRQKLIDLVQMYHEGHYHSFLKCGGVVARVPKNSSPGWADWDHFCINMDNDCWSPKRDSSAHIQVMLSQWRNRR